MDSSFGRRESERRRSLMVPMFALTAGIFASLSFAAVCVKETDGIRIGELPDTEYFTRQEISDPKQDTVQRFAPTLRESDDQLPTDEADSDERRIHRRALLKEEPLPTYLQHVGTRPSGCLRNKVKEPLQRCKRNTGDGGSSEQDKTSGDKMKKKDKMLTSTRLRATSEVRHKESYKEEPHYCPFFDNRAPSAQPNLRNCSWYQSRSCCQQREIDIIFLATYPLSAASDECLKQLSFLYCYVCDPAQVPII
ncbi:uncharacterized protein LOC144881496 [Branchiostoma floridae x Branchiostoma japonicum]